MVTCFFLGGGGDSRRGCWDREARSTWSGRSPLKVLAGLAMGEKYLNLSCALIKKKKKKAAEWVCPALGEARAEGKRGAAYKPAARGGRERRAWFLPERALSGIRLRSRKPPWLHAGSPFPILPEKGKVASPPWSHFGAMWGWANASHATPVFIYLSKSLRKPPRSILSPWGEAKASLLNYLVLPHSSQENTASDSL